MKATALPASMIAVLAVLLIILSSAGTRSTLPQALGDAAPPPLTALTRAAVVDADTGMMLYGLGADEPFSPVGGPVTLMTALVALEHLDLGDTVTVGAEVHVPATVLQWGLREGDTLTVQDLLAAMLLAGAQDAASALTACISRQAGDAVALMNQKAADLGMTDTRYMSATGSYSADQITTVRDLLILAAEAEKEPELVRLLSLTRYETQSADIKASSIVVNRVTLMDPDCAYYDGGITAMVIGSTKASGFNCVISARYGGTHILAALCRPAPAEGYEQDAKALLYYAVNEFDRVDLGPLVRELAGEISLETPTCRIKAAAAAGFTLTVSASRQLGSHMEEFLHDFTLTADPSSIPTGLETGSPMTAVLAFRGQHVADIPLTAIAQEPEPTQPVPSPVPDRQPGPFEKNGWIVWIAIAALAAGILIAASRTILKKIYEDPHDIP